MSTGNNFCSMLLAKEYRSIIFKASINRFHDTMVLLFNHNWNILLQHSYISLKLSFWISFSLWLSSDSSNSSPKWYQFEATYFITHLCNNSRVGRSQPAIYCYSVPMKANNLLTSGKYWCIFYSGRDLHMQNSMYKYVYACHMLQHKYLVKYPKILDTNKQFNQCVILYHNLPN